MPKAKAVAVGGEGNVMLPKRRCLRCNGEWVPRQEAPPVACPHCGNPFWNRPRRNRGYENKEAVTRPG